jgi:hypothetical protein
LHCMGIDDQQSTIEQITRSRQICDISFKQGSMPIDAHHRGLR